MIEIGLFYLELKTKSKILQEIINDVRAKHRYLCVETRLKLKELQKPFLGLRMAFINPKVKNRTYKVKGLELKHLSVLPVNSRKRKFTEFISYAVMRPFLDML